MNRKAWSMALLGMLLAAPGLALEPIDARLGGFGGAGVAVAPLPGQSCLRINPAAPALLTERVQIRVAGVGGGIEREAEGDVAFLAGRTDAYVSLGEAALFGGMAGEIRVEDANDDGEYEEEDDLRYGTSEVHLGLAGSMAGGILSLGAEGVAWRSYQEVEVDHRDHEYELGPELLARGGLLLRMPSGVNLGIVYGSEASDMDGDSCSGYAQGVPATLRAGMAYQEPGGRWLVGGEYIREDDLELEGGGELDSRSQAHLYGEVWFHPRLALRFGGAALDRDGLDAIQGSIGGTVRLGSRVGLEIFARSVSYDEDEDEEFDDRTEAYGGMGLTIHI